MDLIQHVWKRFLQVSEAVLDVIDDRLDYAAFELKLQEELNQLGKAICKVVLEAADDAIKQDRKKRPDWIVQRKGDKKRVLTPFGQMEYERTYYRHKHTGEYAYLVDRAAGLKPHAKADLAVKANLVDMATEVSYRKAGAELSRSSVESFVSGQTVMNAIRQNAPVSIHQGRKPSDGKKQICTLHVQADEDHVKTQDGRTVLAKLVYVSEGYVSPKAKRKALHKVYHIAGLYNDNEELYRSVWEYIDANYDMDSIENLFVYGDGAAWIRGLADYLPGSVFLLDRYHINKSVMGSLAFCPELRDELWDAVNDCDLTKAKAALREAFKRAETEAAESRVTNCRTYLVRNWDGVSAWKEYSHWLVGCSAEGHVSHVLSARLSSRPMAWSETGADQMAKLRAMKANGVCIREHILKQAEPHQGLMKAVRSSISRQRQALKKVSGEVFDNLPALQGANRSLRRALRHISSSIRF